MGRGGGGGSGSALSRRTQYSSDRYNSGSNNRFDDARRGRCATSEYDREDSPPRNFVTNEDNYEEFPAWKESNNRASRRALSKEDLNTGGQDSRHRRVCMFNM